jgi:hypothetical protein
MARWSPAGLWSIAVVHLVDFNITELRAMALTTFEVIEKIGPEWLEQVITSLLSLNASLIYF